MYIIVLKRGTYLERFQGGKPVWTQERQKALRFEVKPIETLIKLGLSNRHLIREGEKHGIV